MSLLLQGNTETETVNVSLSCRLPDSESLVTCHLARPGLEGTHPTTEQPPLLNVAFNLHPQFENPCQNIIYTITSDSIQSSQQQCTEFS